MVVHTVHGVRIVTSFSGWKPKFQVLPTVKSLLHAAPKKYLVGLDAVVLTNVAALNHDRRRRRFGSRGRKSPITNILGLYHPQHKVHRAWIELFVDNISKRWPNEKPGTYFRVDRAFAKVFYHELGHHIHAQHLPEYRPKENVADRWSQRMTTRYLWRNHWESFIILGPLVLFWQLIGKLRRRISAQKPPNAPLDSEAEFQ